MFYGDSIQDTRPLFFTSWDKYKKNSPLLPLENEIVAVIQAHPEYHAIFDNPDRYLEQSYAPESGETNPFLHLGLHLAVREQIATNRPVGIKKAYQQLIIQMKNPLLAEHRMMEQLVACLWQAQNTGQAPDEQVYLLNLLEKG
jgi:hypothetical protein